MACTWLAATAGFVARVPLAHAPTTATRGRPLACAEDPASVVSAQLRALQSGETASLRVCHGFMSPAYHERADALEHFTEWFESPVYESLLRSAHGRCCPHLQARRLSPTLSRCSSWKIRGAVVTREAMQENPSA